jgi:hypothetical protein
MEIGIKGISYSATERKYLVRVKKDSKRVYVGRYSSLEEAKEALESYTETPKAQSTTPILESLRATFAPKSAKTSKPSKVKFSEPVKVTKQPKAIGTKKVKSVQQPQEATSADLLVKDYSATLSAMNQVQAERNLHLILKYLLIEADKRGTSVFDVVVQEVAKLSK